MNKLFSIIVLLLFVNLLPAQVSKTVVISEPGTLNQLISVSERELLTNLTLNGNVNAKDFFLLRDSFPNLSVLDISNVNIAEYSGTFGQDANVMSFPVNEIPYTCFFKGSLTNPNTVLSSIKLPVSATSIGDLAFVLCTNLNDVELPNGIARINQTALVGSSIRMVVNSENNYFSSRNGVLFNKKGNVLIHCPITQTGDFKVQQGIDSLASFSFYGCSFIQSFELPSSVNFIGSMVLANCFGLKSFKMNTNCERIYYNSDIFAADTLTNSTLYVPFGTKNTFSQYNTWNAFGNIIASDQGFCSDKSTVSMPYNASNDKISISSTVNWTAEVNQSWVSLSQSSGLSGTEVVEIAVQENQSINERNAIITFNSPGFDPQTVEITQTTGPRIINLTAGGLISTINQAERKTIKSIIVKGTIDARDFRILRDSMPLLEELNLKEANIIAYSGTEGTRVEITTYKENCIPPYALESGMNYNYLKIKKIYLPPNTLELGDGAFAISNQIDTIYLGEKLETLGAACFQGCTKLTNINLPQSVKSIKSYAFLTCTGLKTLVVNSPTPVNLSSEFHVFNSIDFNTCILKVPYGSAASYAKANQWSDFNHIIEFKNSVNTIVNEPLNQVLKVYPNPITDNFIISNFEGSCTINLMDLNGRVIVSKQVMQNEPVNIRTLPAGIYVLKLKTSNGVTIRKIVKEERVF